MAGLAKKNDDKPQGAPEWMVTFGDMMSLLLCFFVMLLAMSEIKKDETYHQVVKSIAEAFGYDSNIGQIPSLDDVKNSVIDPQTAIDNLINPQQYGEESDQSADGEKLQTRWIREGLDVKLGSVAYFKQFSADLLPQTHQMLDRLARELEGHYNKIEVRGHATRQPLPDDSPFKDDYDLSYARAKAVRQALIDRGVPANLIRLGICGATEPIVKQPTSEQEWQKNRRVEIVVYEALAEQYEGQAKQPFERPVQGG